MAIATRLSDRVRLFGLGVAGFYGGAKNQDSPLLRSTSTFGITLGFSWSFYRSDARGFI